MAEISIEEQLERIKESIIIGSRFALGYPEATDDLEAIEAHIKKLENRIDFLETEAIAYDDTIGNIMGDLAHYNKVIEAMALSIEGGDKINLSKEAILQYFTKQVEDK